jgi:5-methylcytosine-specific restriction enzyme A
VSVSAAAVSFGQFCANLGVPQRSGYSWSSVNRDKKKAIFTIWDNEIDRQNNAYEFWNFEADDPRLKQGDGRKRKNPLEHWENLVEALDKDYQTLGILCTPHYPLTVPRSRKSYFDKKLLAIQLQRTPTGIVGKFQGGIRVADFLSGVSIPNSIRQSALDDLDDDQLGDVAPSRIAFSGTFFARDDKIRSKVIKRAKGCCEYCGELGFLKSDGAYYVEAHHIISMAKQGPDTLDNVIALCPNHHRQAHFGVDWKELEEQLKTKLAKIRGR